MTSESKDRCLRVLVVEDAFDQAFFLSSILDARGHEVRTAQDGQTALNLWDAEPFDVVVTDLNLPGMDGVELTRALKSPERSAFVIAVTAYEEGEYIDAARRAGVDHLLRKPLDLETFVALVEESKSEKRARTHSGLVVLAVGARPGDAIFGCGGTLVRHRQLGDEVVVIAESGGPRGDAAKECARRAADVLELDVRFLRPAGGPESDADQKLTAIVSDTDPDVVYLPAARDYDVNRRESRTRAVAAIRAVAATDEARRVFGYLTPSSPIDFAPDTLRIVTPQMPAKLQAIEAFADLGDPALTERFVRAAAQWWGRSLGFAEVEPFEQIRE